MTGERRKKTLWPVGAATLLGVVLVLAGCGTATIEAQLVQGRQINTFTIQDNTFSIQTNTVPIIDIFDGATRYTMSSQTTLNFTQSDGVAQQIFLEADEIVIERPLAKTVTVVQDRSPL